MKILSIIDLEHDIKYILIRKYIIKKFIYLNINIKKNDLKIIIPKTRILFFLNVFF